MLFRSFIIFILNRLKFISLFVKEYHVLVKLRNYKILIDVTEQFEKHNKIAIIYGEGHLNHLVKNFKKLNFKIVEKSYLESFK